MNCFQINVDGIRHHGAWIKQGNVVEVRSPYGGTTMALDGREPPLVARDLHVRPTRSCPRRAMRPVD